MQSGSGVMTIRKYCFAFIVFTLFLGCGRDDIGLNGNTDESVSRDIDSTRTTAASYSTTIVFFGDSITAGYGLEQSYAFPALLADRFDSLGMEVEIRNAGVSGETTAGGLRRIDWILNQPVDVLVVELGGNDGLRGVSVAETESNLRAIISKARESHPDITIVLAGMQLPPNMGSTYTTAFAEIFPRIAADEDVELIPFILQGVGGIPDLNQRDGIHPTRRGHEIIAANIWPQMKSIVENLN